MFSVGKKCRPAITHGGRDYLLEAGDPGHHSSAGRHTAHGDPAVGCEHNHALAIPGAPATDGGVTEDLHRPPVAIDLLQLAVGETPDHLAIRRPEGGRATVL